MRIIIKQTKKVIRRSNHRNKCSPSMDSIILNPYLLTIK